MNCDGGKPGQDVAPLTDEWMLDIEGIVLHEAELRDKQNKQR